MDAPVAVVAGTGVDWRLARLAYSSWGGRTFGLAGRGLGDLEASYGQLERRLLRFAGSGEITLAGHSQGALHAVRFALDHPELVRHVIGVAGPFLGAGLTYGSMLSGCVAGMARDSLWLAELRKRALKATVPLTLIAGSRDLLVNVDSAWGLPVPGARRILLARGHTALLWEPDVPMFIRTNPPRVP